MDTILASLASSLSAEALKSWGAFALCLLLLGVWLWRERKTNETLRLEIKEINAARIDEVKQLSRVVEASTQTATARAQGDAVFLETVRKTLEAVIDHLEGLGDRMQAVENLLPKVLLLPPPAPPPPPHQPTRPTRPHRGPR